MKGCVFMNTEATRTNLEEAIIEEIQAINLHILAIGKYCSTSNSSDELYRLKAERSGLSQQLANMRLNNTHAKRF